MSKKLKLGFERGAIAAAVCFFILTLAFLLHRHYSSYASYASFDQGIFNQLFWNGTHGRMFQSSLSSTLSAAVTQDKQLPEVFYYRLGQHFTPALLLWLPIYALFPSPATLLVLQVTLITAAGLVLYILARERLSPQLSTLIVVSFYAAKSAIGPSLANFSDLCQLPLYMFGLFLALEKRWWWLFAGLAVLILTIREDTGVVLFSVGFYLVLSKRYPRIGILVCALSLGYMLVVTNLVMPLFSEDVSRRFTIEQFGQYVEGDRASTIEVIWGLVSNPWRLLIEIFTPFSAKLNYLLSHGLALAFVPAVSPPAWMLTAFPLLQIFTRQDSMALSSNARYALTLLPGLFYGAILWWSQHPTALKPAFRRFWIICISLSLLVTFTSNPHRAWSFLLPNSFKPWVYVSLPRQWEHVGQIHSFLEQIPPKASVSATTHIVPHLSSRRELLRFPGLSLRNDAKEAIAVDYAIADLWQLQQYQPAFLDDRNRLRELVPVIEQILAQGVYGLIGCKDGVLFMKRGVPSNPTALLAWQKYRQEIEPILHLPTE